ncbi:MAG: hypothetical protein IJP68_05245 [Selenomonadaceae bacterium]|nr:hypothetical protein [Selenomonadaceae bacterium]
MSKAAVVIPIYKEELDDLEKISLAQVRKILKNYPMIFVAPEGKNFSYLEPGEMLVQFHPQYFQSVKTYSQLLMQPFFYEPFLPFEYILLYQLDAFVFYDALEDFCRLGYDYIGAAWPRYSWPYQKVQGKTPRVGNGGFCLRKVSACHKLLRKASTRSDYNDALEKFTEDTFFAICGMLADTDFNIAPFEVANLFAMEWYPDRHVKKLRGELPFGCHNWAKFSADFYVELFAQLGYDLRSFRDKMQAKDYEFQCAFWLTKIAMKRLIRELEPGKSLLQYLPTKNFASVRVIFSPDAMKILSQLFTEENSLADKIFIYDEKDFRDLINDVERENLPHLVICADYDKSLVAAIEDKNVVSFQREYLKAQEKLFHNLGR